MNDFKLRNTYLTNYCVFFINNLHDGWDIKNCIFDRSIYLGQYDKIS